ncbi:MAG: TonB-dependent receptor [Gemmatimonadetes bacterium]|nr:TonB-dependent receptor [Gemmatimonadota bacterium]NIQ60135.1 TonB-dependent receptor [Gemmatimonadota bacterium]NIU80349.1 TonB-dependent receptor [Gammaproteobacteria bacterium]NIX48704.1 TonB-dependent receptor [Gemmatimonadota bacterium]NIY13157.1 TonB-dependent receptor [Gemmatimonadota bacterium]
MTVLTGEELRVRGVRTVAEALRAVPGATVVRAGAEGAQTSLFLRGGESDYVKVLVDGVPVNDPGGAFDFADLSTDQVERIEVVRGPVSVLYGSDAVAGVVQIFTRRGDGEPRLTLSATGGRGDRRHAEDGYGVADAAAGLTGGTDRVSYAVGASRSWSEGLYPLNAERDLVTASGRLAWRPGPATELAVSSRLGDSRSGFPTDGTGALVDENAGIDRRRWTTVLDAGWQPHERIDAHLRFGVTSRRQESTDAPDGPADTLGIYASELTWDVTRRSADARVGVALPGSRLTAGIVLERAVAATSYDSRSEWGATTADAEYDRSNTGYYVQLLGRPLDRLHLMAGGRIDDNQTFGTFATYRLGATLRILGATRLRAALGRGFREPAFDESFGSGFGDLGNPGLQPERSRSWEAGIEQRLTATVSVTATWFDQRFRDLIQFTFAPPEPGDPNYYNVGAARARGLELEARLDRGTVRVDASYVFLDSEVLDPGLASDASFAQGQPLLRRPAHSGSLAGRLVLDHATLGLTVHAVGEREDLDFAAGFPAPRITLPAHATLDLAAEHAIPLGAGPAPRIIVEARNLLNENYQSIAGFPAAGRIVRLGVRLRL